MDPHATETLGYIGAAILNTSAIPQIYKCYKTKSAKDLSWGFFATLGSGMIINFAYGILIDHPAIYCGSSISFVLYGTIAGMKYYFEHVENSASNESSPFPSPLPLSQPASFRAMETEQSPLCSASLNSASDLRTKI